MRSPRSLRKWLRTLLPTAGEAAVAAGWWLVWAWLWEYTTHLCQLARQCGRPYTARTCRQYLGRWLAAPQWAPETLYAGLAREVRRVIGRQRQVPLLIDFTYLSHRWAVLQVSVGWQRRALPIYRAVFRRRSPEIDQTTAVQAACAWLRGHLPGPAGRYIVVMDRGFPGHRLLNWLAVHSWRYVVRVSGKWRMQHPGYTGVLREAVPAGVPVGPVPRLYRGARWGRQGKGQDEWSEAHVVLYHGLGYQAPWYLLTNLGRAARVVAVYRQRMQIEQEFRDLKGPWGLNHLATWRDRERVARLLAWTAVYEWWLAQLWETHHLETWSAWFRVSGPLSWIRITREWLKWQLLQPPRHQGLACL